MHTEIPTFIVNETGGLVPFAHPGHVVRVAFQGVPPLSVDAPYQEPTIVRYDRQRFEIAVMWTRAERRALARVGTRGRRGARRVLPIHRDEVHVFAPEGATMAPRLHAEIAAVFRARTPRP